MYEATFELEAITPVFMRGADQGRAEFRSASVKGVMRWWFRALAGNYFGNNVEALRRVEGRIFGSAGDGRSRVNIIARPSGGTESKGLYSRPRKFDSNSWVEDLSYLFFSIKLTAKKLKDPKFYPPESKFVISIRSYDRASYTASIASLWIALALGGFGFRSRRGAGSLWFTDGNVDSLRELELPSHINSPSELSKGIKRAIELVGSALGKENKTITPFPAYPVLSERTSYVGIIEFNSAKKDAPKDALKEFQWKYSSFRRKSENKTKMIVFGLPIKNIVGNARRASPMVVTVIPMGHNKYGLVVSKFRTKPFGSFHHSIPAQVDWGVLSKFDGEILHSEKPVFGSLEVFR